LKSLEIEEKINCIRWCKNRGNGMFLLSTNDKTVKLWKIYEKNVVERENFNFIGDGAKGSGQIISALKVPTVRARRKAVTAVPRRVFSNAHAYHINSVSVNSDGER
jgi:serine/threonine-protein phosphatase 2A regulatory subunit B